MQVVPVIVVEVVPNSISVSVSVSTSSSSVAVSPSVALGVDKALVLVASETDETERALFVGLPPSTSDFSTCLPPVAAAGRLTSETETEPDPETGVDTEVDSEGLDDWDLCVRERRGTRTRSARGLRWPYIRSMSACVCVYVCGSFAFAFREFVEALVKREMYDLR